MRSRNGLQAYANPYLMGVVLGLALLFSFLVLGAGLGASGALARLGAQLEGLIARQHVAQSAYFGELGERPLWYYLCFMVVGIFVGSLFSALVSGRVRFVVERGLRSSPLLRLALALAGGVLVGFASRLARGCTSGQGLTGAALLSVGSFVFILCVFVGGYAGALLVRRQWHD